MHAGCMQAALRRYAGGCRMQQPACRRLQVAAACMQPACRLHAACITLQVKPPPLKNTCTFPASTPCAGRQRPASRGRRPAHRRRRPACRLQAGCMQGVDAKKIRREWTCSFSAYFSERIFLFLAYDSMLWCHRDVICDARDLQARRVYCLSS